MESYIQKMQCQRSSKGIKQWISTSCSELQVAFLHHFKTISKFSPPLQRLCESLVSIRAENRISGKLPPYEWDILLYQGQYQPMPFDAWWHMAAESADTTRRRRLGRDWWHPVSLPYKWTPERRHLQSYLPNDRSLSSSDRLIQTVPWLLRPMCLVWGLLVSCVWMVENEADVK